MKWNVTDAGPIQVSKIKKAWTNLGVAFCTYLYKNVPGMTVTIFNLGAAMSGDETAAKSGVGEKYAWTISRANAKSILSDIEAASAVRIANSPCETTHPARAHKATEAK